MRIESEVAENNDTLNWWEPLVGHLVGVEHRRSALGQISDQNSQVVAPAENNNPARNSKAGKVMYEVVVAQIAQMGPIRVVGLGVDYIDMNNPLLLN